MYTCILFFQFNINLKVLYENWKIASHFRFESFELFEKHTKNSLWNNICKTRIFHFTY